MTFTNIETASGQCLVRFSIFDAASHSQIFLFYLIVKTIVIISNQVATLTLAQIVITSYAFLYISYFHSLHCRIFKYYVSLNVLIKVMPWPFSI